MIDLINSNPDFQIVALMMLVVFIYLLATFISFFRKEEPRHSKGEINHKLMRSVLDDQDNHNNIR